MLICLRSIIFRLLCLFVCKQKTANEVRISDWSSDVCSSDLLVNNTAGALQYIEIGMVVDLFDSGLTLTDAARTVTGVNLATGTVTFTPAAGVATVSGDRITRAGSMGREVTGFQSIRSEEHTSELQSLMRISYAVFCLKNKNIPKQL